VLCTKADQITGEAAAAITSAVMGDASSQGRDVFAPAALGSGISKGFARLMELVA